MLFNQNIDPTKDPSQKTFLPWRLIVAAWEWLVPPTVAHRDRQTPLARWIAGFIIASICTTLLILGLMYARPLKNSYKNMRAQSMVKEARNMMENGQGVNAVMKAQEAYTNAPESIDAIRLNFEYFTMMKRDTALYFYDKLKDRGDLTPLDEQLHIRCLMNLGRAKEASVALEKLMRVEQPSEALMKLAEEVWGKREQNKPLLNILNSYVKDHPDDSESRLRLAKVQITSTVPSEVSQGMETLWSIASQDDLLGLQTLEFISSLSPLTPEDTKKLVQRLKTHPKADDRHYAAALTREVQMAPHRKKEIVMEAVARCQGKKRDQLLPLVRWLVEQGEPAQVLNVVTEEEAKGHQGLLTNYLNALTIYHRIDAVERLINDPQVANILNPTDLAMYHAHLAFVKMEPTFNRKEPTEAEKQTLRTKLIFAKDMAASDGRYPALLQIAAYGETRNQFDIAEDASRLAIKAARRASAPPRIEREAYAGLIRASEANHNTEALLAAAQEAVQRWPDDNTFIERHLYVSLLVGKNIELAQRQAKTLLQARPKDHPRRLALALAHWRLQEIEQAVSYLQYMDLNFLTQGQQAVFAAIANSGGFHDEAVGVLKRIDQKAGMLPEEKQFYDRALIPQTFVPESRTTGGP